jgi:hypothetical protein
MHVLRRPPDRCPTFHYSKINMNARGYMNFDKKSQETPHSLIQGQTRRYVVYSPDLACPWYRGSHNPATGRCSKAYPRVVGTSDKMAMDQNRRKGL